MPDELPQEAPPAPPVIRLPPRTSTTADSGINDQVRAWPWHWNGTDAVVPAGDAEGEDTSEAVYRLRVRGAEDLERAFEVVQPDGEPVRLAASFAYLTG